jgi:acyl-homoserine lactone acylase PvdQ
LLAGGNSGDSKSKRFNDQAAMYQKRKFKDVYFTKKMSAKKIPTQPHQE